MANYSDWLEATAGGTASDFSGGLGTILEDGTEALVQRMERDAILCLVDCRQTMFDVLPMESPLLSSAVKEEGTTVTDAGGRCGTASAASMTPFSQALRCVLQLYQEKLITSDRDILALCLYNTSVKRNVYDFPGVYVVHPFTLLGADSVQEVEQLEASGAAGSPAYRKFLAEVGHSALHQPPALSDALWAAQHMFLSIGSSTVKFKRIFIFTNDDAPARGDALEQDRCVARARDLHEAGVVLEVFGLGEESTNGQPTATTPTTVGSESIFASVPQPPSASSIGVVHLTTGDSSSTGTAVKPPAKAQTFSRHRFWGGLLEEAARRTDWAVPAGGSSSRVAAYAGAVFVSSRLQSSFQDLLDVVRRKMHPQRPYLNTSLSIGLRRDGGSVPRMDVSIYHPLMPARPPRTAWLEGSTNALLKRQTRLVRKGTAAHHGGARQEGDDRACEETTHGGDLQQQLTINPEETRYTVSVGGVTLSFTAAERRSLTEVAAGGANVGLTIVCFKRYEDVVQAKHAVHRSAFLHPNLRNGGGDALRLFVQLVRTLRKQQKVAIAQYIMRKGAAPKLMALVPSPTASEAELAGSSAALNKLPAMTSVPLNSLPAEGLGLYVVFLPYADDIRSVPRLSDLTSVNKEGPTQLDGEAADILTAAERQLGRQVVNSLTVPYDIAAVPNPTLQRVYHTLQELALRRLVKTEGSEEVEAAAAGVAGSRRGDPEDYTIPDRAGMARYACLFHDFNTHILNSSYDADELCPQPREGTVAATRRPRAPSGATTDRDVNRRKGVADDILFVVQDHARRNAWHRLTVAQLKAYLAAVNVPTGGATKKDELVAAAQKAYHQML